jgi:DNA-binding beta-propeller fold protein YncE
VRLESDHWIPLRVCASAYYCALGLLLAAPVCAQEPSGTLIVLNKADATASLVDLASGRTVATLPTGEGPHEVAVSPDGRWAVASNYGGQAPGHTLTVLDLRQRMVARTVDLGEYQRPHGLAWTGDGRRLLVTSEASRTVVVVDTRSWTVERAIATDSLPVHMVAVSADGRRAYAASIQAGRVVMLDLAGARTIRTTPVGAGSEGIAMSPDAHEVWVACRGANTVGILDAATLQLTDTVPSASFPIRVRFTPEGRRVLVSNARSGEVRVSDAQTRRAVATIAVPYDSTRAVTTMLGAQFAGSALPIGVLASPDGRRAYVAASAMGEVLELDMQAWTITRRFTTGREPDGLGFSPLRITR